MDKLLINLPNFSEPRRFVIVNSLRYALEGKIPSEDFVSESTEHYISSIMNQIFDKSLNVKSGALKSLNSIVNGHLFVMEIYFTEEIINQLIDFLRIKEENIIVVDYGVNKEKKDLAKPLRTEAFNFLLAIINQRKLEGHFEELIRNSLEKINE